MGSCRVLPWLSSEVQVPTSDFVLAKSWCWLPGSDLVLAVLPSAMVWIWILRSPSALMALGWDTSHWHSSSKRSVLKSQLSDINFAVRTNVPWGRNETASTLICHISMPSSKKKKKRHPDSKKCRDFGVFPFQRCTPELSWCLSLQ